jgi:hypothetical protein
VQARHGPRRYRAGHSRQPADLDKSDMSPVACAAMARPRSAPIKLNDGRLLPGGTPQEVIDFVAANPAGKAPTTDPGMHVTVRRRTAAPAARKLVVLGDSLSHGFKDGAVRYTDKSWGAILAEELGAEYRTPDFDIAWGMPVNLDTVARSLDVFARPDLSQPLRGLWNIRKYLGLTYDAWVTGPGAIEPYSARSGVRIDALAQFGFDLTDAMARTEFTERNGIGSARKRRFVPTIPNAGLRSSARVLSHVHDADGRPLSLVDGARYLGDHGGIDTLVVALGANNALGSVRSLNIAWSGADHMDLERKDAYNVWTPEHFREAYGKLMRGLRTIKAERVVLCTIPHVTIAPFAHGINGKDLSGSRYFKHYVYPVVTEETFNPHVDAHLTAADARAIDGAIDCYNQFIEQCVREARLDGRDWRVLDMAGLLDRLAYRRYLDDPAARPGWWEDPVIPEPLRSLNPEPDTRFLRTEPGRPGSGVRTQGGWFSLDGIHATTIGYAYLAWHAANLLHEAGVEFPNLEPDGTVAFDWDRWIAADVTISSPPASVGAALDKAGTALDWYQAIRHPFRSLRHDGSGPGSSATLGR